MINPRLEYSIGIIHALSKRESKLYSIKTPVIHNLFLETVLNINKIFISAGEPVVDPNSYLLKHMFIF